MYSKSVFDMLQPQSPRKKKKKKSDVEAAVGNLDLIAMGTTSGTVLLYSFARGQVHTHLVCICCVPFVVGNVLVVAFCCWQCYCCCLLMLAVLLLLL